MANQVTTEPQAMSDVLDTAAGWSLIATQRVAAAGVFIMLLIAAISMIDIIIFRTLLNGAVTGFNEILQTFFAAALAAVLAGGFAQRSALRADMVVSAFSARQRAWFDVLAEAILLVFLMVLAYACWHQTFMSFALRSQTTILHIPTGPVVAAIFLFVAICLPVQLINTLIALKASVGWRSGEKTRALNAFLVFLLVATTIVFTVYWGVLQINPVAWENPVVWASGMFVVLWIMVLAGIPIGACLGFCGITGAAMLLGWEKALVVVGNETTDLFTNANLALIPLFLMMGALASVAGLSTDIYRLAQAALGSRRGGLAMATIGACAGFGALTGSSIATAATIGSVAIPQMRERGYAPSLAAGCIAAGATLGQLVPPSTVIVLYALLVEESVGQLYMAILGPALLTILFYFIAIAIVVRIKPEAAPGTQSFQIRELIRSLRGAIVVLLVFSSVIGGIYFGVFTATEAASIGVVLTFLAALFRGKLKGPALWKAATETTNSVAMIYPLIVGALLLTFYLDLAGLPIAVTEFIGGLGLSPLLTIVLLCALFVALGSVMDSIAVMIITAGLVAPLVTSLGYDAIWWGVMMIVIVELGVVTPPFGLNLFMLKSIAPDVPAGQIYRGVMPFVLADVFKIALLIAFPAIALWLPSTMQ